MPHSLSATCHSQLEVASLLFVPDRFVPVLVFCCDHTACSESVLARCRAVITLPSPCLFCRSSRYQNGSAPASSRGPRLCFRLYTRRTAATAVDRRETNMMNRSSLISRCRALLRGWRLKSSSRATPMVAALLTNILRSLLAACWGTHQRQAAVSSALAAFRVSMLGARPGPAHSRTGPCRTIPSRQPVAPASALLTAMSATMRAPSHGKAAVQEWLKRSHKQLGVLNAELTLEIRCTVVGTFFNRNRLIRLPEMIHTDNRCSHHLLRSGWFYSGGRQLDLISLSRARQ